MTFRGPQPPTPAAGVAFMEVIEDLGIELADFYYSHADAHFPEGVAKQLARLDELEWNPLRPAAEIADADEAKP